jgi:hypothetical protein
VSFDVFVTFIQSLDLVVIILGLLYPVLLEQLVWRICEVQRDGTRWWEVVIANLKCIGNVRDLSVNLNAVTYISQLVDLFLLCMFKLCYVLIPLPR